MNKNIGLQLVVYSVVIACLGYIAYYLAPALARPTLLAGLAGGALCLVWGLRTVAGSRGKALPVLTLIPVNFVLLSQVVIGWLGGGEGVTASRAAASAITLAFLTSMAMLMRIVYAGVLFDGERIGPTNAAETKPQSTRTPAAQAVRRA
jgi:hypothetical protein